jgi:hypothetical protein
MRPICSALAENKSALGPIEISPAGTAENSPGRQSWVHKLTETSPAGTAENAPGRQSWVTWTTRECHWQSSKANRKLYTRALIKRPRGTRPTLLTTHLAQAVQNPYGNGKFVLRTSPKPRQQVIRRQPQGKLRRAVQIQGSTQRRGKRKPIIEMLYGLGTTPVVP